MKETITDAIATEVDIAKPREYYFYAYQFFRRALQEMPGNKAIWTSLGRAAHELNMYEDALKYFLKSGSAIDHWRKVTSLRPTAFIASTTVEPWASNSKTCF